MTLGVTVPTVSQQLPSTSCRVARRWFVVACLIVLVLMIWHVRNLMDVEDAVVYFSHFNNSATVQIPFYYTGYVALYTELSAYAASFLPFPWQPLIYICAASLVGTYFTYQLLVFMDDVLKAPLLSTVFAFLLIAFMVRTHGTFNLFVNLTYNIWIGWLGLYLRVLNGLRGRPAGPATILLGVLSAWSHSFIVVLILPLLGALVLSFARIDMGTARAHRRDPRILVEFGIYLVAAVLFPIVLIEPGFPKPLDIPHIPATLLHMLFDLHSNMLVTICIGVLLVAIALPVAFKSCKSLLRGISIAQDDYLLLVMAFVGLGTVAIVFASGRIFIADKIWARYLFTPFLSLFLGGLLVASHRPRILSGIADVERRLYRLLAKPGRRLVAGLCIVALLGVTGLVPWRTVSSSLAQSIDTERFLVAAERYRATCREGAFIRAWDKWSLAVLCHRRDLPADSEAVSLTDDNVIVWGQEGQSRTADHAKADVPMLFQPLDVMKLPGR